MIVHFLEVKNTGAIPDFLFGKSDQIKNMFF
jgi:hypothetical protein